MLLSHPFPLFLSPSSSSRLESAGTNPPKGGRGRGGYNISVAPGHPLHPPMTVGYLGQLSSDSTLHQLGSRRRLCSQFVVVRVWAGDSHNYSPCCSPSSPGIFCLIKLVVLPQMKRIFGYLSIKVRNRMQSFLLIRMLTRIRTRKTIQCPVRLQIRIRNAAIYTCKD